MAVVLNEACQLWLEQRVEEERENGDGKSVRSIARALVEEIERLFEVRMNEETVRSVVRKKGGETYPPAENPHEQRAEAGDSGDKKEVVKKVQVKVRKGTSERQAAKEVAEETGKKVETVRKAVQREKKNTAPPRCVTDSALRYAQMAIADLECIGNHPSKEEAFDLVEQWIENHRG